MRRFLVTRDRMGRMLTFVARVMEDVASPAVSLARGVGIDERTALLLDVTTGDVTAVGSGTAYVCLADHKAETCKQKTALSYSSNFSIHPTRHIFTQ